MSDAIQEWREIGARNKWKMIKRPHWFLRLPIVRHVWVFILCGRVARHYRRMPIGIPTGYDEWVLWGIWRNLWEKRNG